MKGSSGVPSSSGSGPALGSIPTKSTVKTNGVQSPSLAESGRSRSLGVVSSNEEDEARTADGYTGATIFHRSDRPTIVPQHSFVVGGGKSAPKANSYDTRLSWKSIGENVPRLPSMPSMSDMPSIPFTKSRDSARTRLSMPRIDSESAPQGARADELEQVASPKKQETPAKGIPFKQKLIDLHAKHPNLKDISNPLLPIAVFPGQGTGKSSEFNQEAPIWSRQPYKLLYFAYFGLSVGLVFLPWFAISSLFRSLRGRPSWDWKRSTLIKLYRHGSKLTFRTYTSLSRDLSQEVPHSKTVRGKFVWVDGLKDDLIRGQVRSAMKLQNLKPTRTCGFWYGERDGGGGVGQSASAGEKVIYHLHGGAYWIGTAHEKDVTSAVNMQALRALDAIYDSRLPKTQKEEQESENINSDEVPQRSPHPPSGGPARTQKNSSGGHCKRAFSLDYRLCVPGHPEMGSYPAALLDSLAGYRYLVEECGFESRNIIVAGDSAGGNLALAMCRYLRDEKLYGMPGAMILLSPWADASRSHAGPSGNPNKFSTAYINKHSDIISTSTAFRNTAVSALLGRLPACETYGNPYLSSMSLQLPPDKGGAGPHWGFEGFPRRIYICTGSAEISHDQHLTLAFRLAGGTSIGRPIHSGDQLSVTADSYEMAARLNYPRPQDCEITLWPSAQNVPAGTPLWPPAGWAGDGNGIRQFPSHVENESHHPKTANGYPPRIVSSPEQEDALKASEPKGGEMAGDQSYDDQAMSPSTDAAAANDTSLEAGKGPSISQVKEKDTHMASEVTHQNSHQMESQSSGKTSGVASSADSSSAERNTSINDEQPSKNSSKFRLLEPSYFNVGGEDRTVVLDECRDGVHDYTLFDWYEPERGQTWARIAKWIDEEV